MSKVEKAMTEFERNNLVGMRCHFIVVILMEILALLNFASGQSSFLMFLIYLVTGLFSPIGELICWKKNHETKMIKHFVGYGYAVYYSIVIFTGSDAMLFFFVVPLLLVVSIFNDVAYSAKVNGGVVIESLIITIVGGMTGKFGYTTLNNAIVQNIVVILFAIFSIWVAKTININSVIKINKIQSMMEATDQGIASISEDLKILSESATSVRGAMEEVSDGTSSTAEAVQEQMVMTQEIGQKTVMVETTTSEINDAMRLTMECVSQGRRDLQQLLDEVGGTASASQSMVALLSELQTNMEQMGKISKMIDDIAFQTNILALNANVEAARAGDAGRGFAVVASEVSAMSIRTKDATEEISEMIGNVSASLQEVIDGILKMAEEISEEKASAEKSQASFASIEDNAVAVNERIASLAFALSELTDANHGIMDSIQTISSISEEVSALAAEAKDQEQKNAEVLNHISEETQKLVTVES